MASLVVERKEHEQLQEEQRIHFQEQAKLYQALQQTLENSSEQPKEAVVVEKTKLEQFQASMHQIKLDLGMHIYVYIQNNND